MKKSALLLIFLIAIFSNKLLSQNFVITEPKAEFDGYKLFITYNFIDKSPSDIFYIWVEIRNQAGNPIKVYSFKGDVGDSIKPGSNKKITWIPEDDAVFLDEDVTVEIMGEKYVRSFSRSKVILQSTIVPGLGQTKVKNVNPWWLISIPAYGTLAGGLILHSVYVNSYDDYKTETEPVERQDLYDKSQKQKNLSGALLISSAVIWGGNLIWMSIIPDRYKPLEHAKLSFNAYPISQEWIDVLSLKVTF
jgi:hypothetical protein